MVDYIQDRLVQKTENIQNLDEYIDHVYNGDMELDEQILNGTDKPIAEIEKLYDSNNQKLRS